MILTTLFQNFGRACFKRVFTVAWTVFIPYGPLQAWKDTIDIDGHRLTIRTISDYFASFQTYICVSVHIYMYIDTY